MQRVLFFALFALTILPTTAQVVRTDAGIRQEEAGFFNPRFLRENRVHSITGEVSIKRSMQPISSEGLLRRFDFDDRGNIVRKIRTYRRKSGQVDTTSIAFSYDDVNQLIVEDQRQNHVFDALVYQYDSLGRMTNKIRYRGEDTGAVQFAIEPGKAFRIHADSFAYDSLNHNTIRKTYYNSEGKPYLEDRQTFDTLGNLSEAIQRYTLTRRGTTRQYTYDDLGRIETIREIANLGKRIESLYSYRYNSSGLVEEEKLMVNGMARTTRQFLYEDGSLLLKARLTKKESNDEIEIIRYRYTFFTD